MTSSASAQTFAAAELPAAPAPLAAHALLLDVAHAGARLVAVGLQGVIITSDDAGRTWTQAAVPVSTMLTAVRFVDAQRGWAVGHEGVVLRTSDGGRSWDRVAVPVAGLAEAGPGSAIPTSVDVSFLDVLALAPGHIVLAGAYGVVVATRDDGATWAKLTPPMEDFHLNRLSSGRDGAIYAAGESGLLAVSRDEAATWELFESPYEGSFYGLHELASGRLLAHGLRGHAYYSDDDGAAWTAIAISESVLLMSAVEAAPDTVVLAGLGGHLFVSRDGGSTFSHAQPPGLTSTAEIVVASDGALIAVGETGAHRLEVP